MTRTTGERWAVLGGGLMGQVLALRLREAGHEVTLIEAAPDLGGLAMPWSVAGVTYDKFYHVVLPFDHRTLSLVNELGLQDEVVWKRTQTGFFAKGRLVPLNGAIDYLRLPVIGMVGKLRLAVLLMAGARIRDGAPLDRVPVEDWLVRWCGRGCYEGIWKPLLRAKLGDNYRRASAAFIWASIRRLYLARKGTGKIEELGFVRGGYRRILDALRDRLGTAGVDLMTGTQVKKVARLADGFVVQTSGGTHAFDRVVSTLPASLSARVCEGLTEAERGRLRRGRLPGDRLRLGRAEPSARRVLPHLPHRPDAALHGHRGDVGADRDGGLRGPHARLPAALRDAGRRVLGP